MRRLKQTLLALTICTLVISCSLTTSSTIMKVQRGMSQEEVSHLLGKPDFRRFDNGSEQWEYTKTNMSTAANTVIIIDFVDGMVTNMDSFESNITPPPVAVCPPNEIITVVPPNHPDHSGPHRPKHKAMNPHDFENLYKKVKNKAFKDDQMELLSVGVVNNYFTCKQTARLMSIFTWDDEKMKVLRMISNRIVDRENGKEIIKTQPQYLSLNEMYLVANSYPKGGDDFIKVFDIAVRMYPDDEVANLNAAAVALSKKDLPDARKYLDKSNKQTAEYANNNGIYYLLSGNKDQAIVEFTKASRNGNEAARYNLEEIEKVIKK